MSIWSVSNKETGEEVTRYCAYCWRKGYMRRVAIIDWIMREENHCAKAYLSEATGSQNAPEYRA